MSPANNKSETSHSFYHLGPDKVLQAVESIGFACDGYQLALNSYENRVYQIGIEGGYQGQRSVVAKFYRAGRWSDAAILEEHQFTLDLEASEIRVVPPLIVAGKTLHHFDDCRFSLYPLKPGRAPDLENESHLQQLGRFIGRIHALGATEPFQHRPSLNVETFGDASYEFLMASGFIPPELEQAYSYLAEDLLDAIEDIMDAVDPLQIRLHGDGHPGNILWKEGLQGDAGAPYILDFDDARMGPAIQDLWMFLSGERDQMQHSLDVLLKAYTQFYDFDLPELRLIEPLRTLRMMHHAAWLAQRWSDPIFKHAFPWFHSQRYWEGHILELKEQAALLNEPPLQWI